MPRRFRDQLLLFFLLVIVASTGVAMAMVWRAADRAILRQAEQSLTVAERVFRELMERNARQLGDRARLLAEDYGFKEAIATNERATVIGVLANHGERIGADLMVLLSPDGRIVESTHHIDHAEELAGWVAAGALGDARLLMADGEVFQLVLAPVRAPDLIAWTGLGFTLDAADAREIKRLALADVSFLIAPEGAPARVLSSLEDGFAAPAGADAGAAERALRVFLARQQMLGSDLPLLRTPTEEVRAVVSVSLGALREAYAPMRQQMLLIASAVILAAALGAVLIARGVTRPVTALMQAVTRIGRGEYHQRVEVQGGNEFAVLATTLNDMQQAIDERESEIRNAANHDILTRLPNRRYLGVLIGEDLQARPDEQPFGFAVIGICKLPELADAYGMNWCDGLLQQIARRFEEGLRRGDRVAQLAREQFLMYCDGLTREGIPAMLDKILAVTGSPFECEGIEVRIDVRLGFVLFPEHGRDYADLIRRASMAFRAAGDTARHYGLYAPDQDERHKRQIRVTHRLQQAIAGGGLSLVYQPKLDLRRARVTQAEALLRWRDAELGPVFPDEFIPLAEQSGDILPLSDWVLREAVAQRARWQAEGIEVEVCVNLSARDFLREDFVERVAEVARAGGVAPRALVLEVTESSTIVDPERAVRCLGALREHGFGLAMDDFGTGYSSLAQLKLLPLDELKIDKSFVLRLDHDADDQKIVKSTIELGHNLGLRVVAEGVENAASLELLHAMGCDAIQGYHLGKPMTPGDFAGWWRAREVIAA